MKKILPILFVAVAAGFINCASIGKDSVSIQPTLKVDTQNILARPTEYHVEVDTNTWIEGKSYKGRELFGISFFENRFVSPTMLNKEGHDSYTLDAIRNAIYDYKLDEIEKEKANEYVMSADKYVKHDAMQLVKSRAEVYAFPFKWFAIYKTVEVTVKGHPIKYKFLGPVSEQKADEIYAAGLEKSIYALELKTPLYPAKEAKAAACCIKQ